MEYFVFANPDKMELATNKDSCGIRLTFDSEKKYLDILDNFRAADVVRHFPLWELVDAIGVDRLIDFLDKRGFRCRKTIGFGDEFDRLLTGLY